MLLWYTTNCIKVENTSVQDIDVNLSARSCKEVKLTLLSLGG